MLVLFQIYYNNIVKFAVCLNEEKSEAQAVARSLCEVLRREGVAFYTARQSLEADTDVVCVVGGDGTLFSYAHLAVEASLPIWFINAGSVGFLAESTADLSARVARIEAGDYRLDSRELLSVTWGDRRYLALNDVCLMRDTKHLQTITLTVSTDAETVAAYRGDGALVCTALGSTGYALSAGAPIMAPSAHGMMFTPICAHSLLAKSVLFGEADRVHLRSAEPSVLFVDGVYTGLVEDREVVVALSDAKVSFVRTEGQSFFEKVGGKLL